MVCSNCDRSIRIMVHSIPPEKYFAKCSSTIVVDKLSVEEKKEPGLGDRVESMLKSIGVTKERYIEVKELFGLPGTCGCSARQEWLNKVGEWWKKQTS